MRTLIKFFLGAVAVVVTLLVVAVVAFALLFDADHYKATAQTLVKDRTGRDLTIAGDLSVSYFPWLGFAMGATTLSDAPGYSDEPFARFDSASARVRLWPLLSKQIEIGQLALDGLDLKLVRNKDGSANWDDLVVAADEPAQDQAAAEQGGGLAALSIGGIRLSEANVSFRDDSAGAVYSVNTWSLQTGALTPGKPFDFETRLNLSASEPQVSGSLEAAGVLTTDMEAGRYTLESPGLKLHLDGEGLPAGSVALIVDGDKLSVVGENITLDAPTISVTLAGGDLPLDSLRIDLTTPKLDVTGRSVAVTSPRLSFNGAGSSDQPLSSLVGNLEAASIRLTNGDAFELPGVELNVDAAGSSLPGGKVDAMLSAGGISGSVAGGTLEVAKVALRGLGLSVSVPTLRGERLTGNHDQSPRFFGTLTVDEFSPRKMANDLAIELPPTADETTLSKASLNTEFSVTDRFARFSKLRLNLDETGVTGQASIENYQTQALRFDLAVDTLNADRYLPPPTEPDESRPVDAVEIPGEQIRALDLQGTLTVGKLEFAGIRSQDVTLGLLAKGGSVRVFPSQAKLYGGTYSGDIRIDATGARLSMSMNEQLTDVKFGELTRDMFDMQRLTGTLNGRVSLKGTGENVKELQRTLNGNAQFKFADGAYEGVDLWHEISKGVALFQKQAVPAGAGEGRTVFSDMSGTATVTDGVLYSDDLSISLPFMRVSGKGTVNLPEQSIDYKVQAKVIRSPQLSAEASKLAGRTVPVSITGPLDSPKVRPDVGAALAGAVQDKIQEKLEDKLGDLLGGALGGRPDDKATADGEQAPDKKEEEKKPRDLLKDLFGGG